MCDDDIKARLRLKNSGSTRNDTEQDGKGEFSRTDNSVVHEDDSLLDFKSPDSKSNKRMCLANFKYKPTGRVAPLKSKSIAKQRCTVSPRD
ncbi:hypothetical protein KM043_000289 [Ampulex compressa]|nr:hypothetical protein KM043_000289 [Ampulex compressa]